MRPIRPIKRDEKQRAGAGWLPTSPANSGIAAKAAHPSSAVPFGVSSIAPSPHGLHSCPSRAQASPGCSGTRSSALFNLRINDLQEDVWRREPSSAAPPESHYLLIRSSWGLDPAQTRSVTNKLQIPPDDDPGSGRTGIQMGGRGRKLALLRLNAGRDQDCFRSSGKHPRASGRTEPGFVRKVRHGGKHDGKNDAGSARRSPTRRGAMTSLHPRKRAGPHGE